MATAETLPSYARQLQTFHREFEVELRSMIAELPIIAGSNVLEIAAGDGQFAIWMSERVGSGGSVIACDLSEAWLKQARQQRRLQQAEQVRIERADATQLPYADCSFDFVWCAQSLYSLPHLSGCLAEMRRVLKPGGKLAIMENDSLHHVLLPWPVNLELQILAAELKAFRHCASQPAKFCAGRWLSRLMRKTGLKRIQERSFAYTRQQPLRPSAQEFFASYLQALRERVKRWLRPRALQRLDPLIAPTSRRCLWRQTDFVAVCIDRVVWAEKP